MLPLSFHCEKDFEEGSESRCKAVRLESHGTKIVKAKLKRKVMFASQTKLCVLLFGSDAQSTQIHLRFPE